MVVAYGAPLLLSFASRAVILGPKDLVLAILFMRSELSSVELAEMVGLVLALLLRCSRWTS